MGVVGFGRPPQLRASIHHVGLSRTAESGPARPFRRTTIRSNDPWATATEAKPVHGSRSTRRAVATPITKELLPLGDRVVVKPSAREEMTKSGIVIPDTAKEKPQEGTIIAAGPGRIPDDGKREQMDIKEGQKVLYAK